MLIFGLKLQTDCRLCRNAQLDSSTDLRYPRGNRQGQAGWHVAVQFKTLHELAAKLKKNGLPIPRQFCSNWFSDCNPIERGEVVRFSLEETPFYHCVARCVRRAFLCGEDQLTGKSFGHRKQWIVDKLKELAEVFAIDVCTYAVMSNHYHLVLRVDPTRAADWSDDEVIHRWRRLFSGGVLMERFLRGEATTQAERDKVAEVAGQWRERLDTPLVGIPFSLLDYLALTDWTGRAIRGDKRGFIPDDVPPILARLGIDERAWVETVRNYGPRLGGVVGPVERLRRLARRWGRRWLRGLTPSRALYSRPAIACSGG